MIWISTSLEKFQNQREMRLRLLIRRTWLRSRESLDSIKDHLIPHLSSLKTPKEVFDALTKMFKGKSINQKMTLRNQLKNAKIQNSKTIQSYFTSLAQIKEQLEAVEENVEE